MMGLGLFSKRHVFKAAKGSLLLKSIKQRCIHSTFSCLKDNIILMGSPGSGKTTVGGRLAQILGMPVTDIDNDVLEPHWKMPVAQKLAEVGGDMFIKAEGEALLQFSAKNTVVSLTGSNPLHSEAMDYIKSTGLVVYLDVDHFDIVKRLKEMKVNRIVGQGPDIKMLDILKFRRQFYEGNYDIRIICEPGESLESITEKAARSIKHHNNHHGYISTRDGNIVKSNVKTNIKAKTFCDVVKEGLAPDGGLYIPNTRIPSFTENQWGRLLRMSYADKALRILEHWLHSEDIHPAKLKSMISNAYSSANFSSSRIVPVNKLQNQQYVAELFHGPTASFKDLALQLMPQFFHHSASRADNNDKSDETRYLILVATSGDTGGAVLDGFSKYGGDNTKVMVLYPEEGISAVQKAQMTAMAGENIHVVGIKSDFDFCQSTIKSIFQDSSLQSKLWFEHNCKLSAANSINWGRLLPQVVYNASNYLALVERKVISMGDPVDLCIPTGNFGNILGAYYAKEMGIPYRHLIIASNRNNVLTEFIKTGTYRLDGRSLQVSISPAIDILKSSNLERFLYHITGGDKALVKSYYKELEDSKRFSVDIKIRQKIQSMFLADWCSEELCLQTIKSTYKKTGYLLDTHTAVAKYVADRYQDNNVPMIIAATAHYAKFADSALHAINGKSPNVTADPIEMFNELEKLKLSPSMHTNLKTTIERPKVHKKVCDADIHAIVKEMTSFLDSNV